jgi:predicted CXXCH cytochrome family protein
MSTTGRTSFCFVVSVALAVCAANSKAYEQYSLNRDATNCRACHGDFRAAGYASFKDGTAWGSSLMDGHSNSMLSGTCVACHTSLGSFFPVLLGNSGDATLNMSCAGCHGRLEDEGTIIGGSVQHPESLAGAGLRQHHWNNGIEVCGDCHADSDPGAFTTAGENVSPPNYSDARDG